MPYNTETRLLSEILTALDANRWGVTVGQPLKVFVDVIGLDNYATVLSEQFGWSADPNVIGQYTKTFSDGSTQVVKQSSIFADTAALRTATVDALRLWGAAANIQIVTDPAQVDAQTVKLSERVKGSGLDGLLPKRGCYGWVRRNRSPK